MRQVSLSLFSALILTSGLIGCGSEITSGSSIDTSVTKASKTDFDIVQAAAIDRIQTQMELPIIVPTPKDAGGGYTHEQHKTNAKRIYDAGQLYTLTGDEKFADYARDVMLAYADVYPNWGLHPAKKEQSPGRMFWQNLNESMFLLNVSQSYGAIKETLTPNVSP